MFLLIQSLLPPILFDAIYFKFHYVSINSKIDAGEFIVFRDFKFHYVSINSNFTYARGGTLNLFKFHYVSINS